LMEINGRFWGSLQLAVACGVDFPQLLLQYLMWDDFPKADAPYRVGLKMKWILGTLDHLIIRLRDKKTVGNPATGFPSKLRSIADFLRIIEKDTVYDVFQKTDRRPFGCELHHYLADLIS